MLCDLAVPWVILGHSERRHVIGGGETSEVSCPAPRRCARDAALPWLRAPGRTVRIAPASCPPASATA